MKIFVSGLSSVETTLKVRGFPVTYYPIDYPFFGISAEAAGSGLRVCRGALSLGDDVEFLTLIGNDVNGRRIEDAIKSAGMSDKFVIKSLAESVESVVLQEVPFGRRQLYCDLKDAQEKTVDPEIARSEIEEADVCALLNINFSRPLLRLAKKLGKKIATDVQALYDVNDTFNAEFIENADILFLSDEGISTSSEEFMRAIVQKTNAEVVVMGLGEDGVLYFERRTGEIKSLKAVTEGDVLTAGAGAALFSAFLHYYGKFGAEDSLKRAEVFAALRLESNVSGGGFATEEQVERKLSEVSF